MGLRVIKRYGWVPALLGVTLTGCKTWQPTTASPEALMADGRPSVVRVTRGDGEQTTLKNPILVNDSLIATVTPRPGALVPPPRIGVPTDDVAEIEVGHFSAARSVALAGVIAAVSIAWAGIQASVGGSEERTDPLPKDAAFDVLGLFRLLRSGF